jgi:Flp pilus assembly protein TadG
MKDFARRLMRRLATETRGAEIAEAAAVLPLMFMILLGIFWFGQAFSIYGAITRAAQEGARAGAIPYCATCTGAPSATTNAANAAQAALQASRLDPTQVRNPSPAPSFLACGGGAAPTCSAGGNPNAFCVQYNVQMTNSGAGTNGLCGVSVSFQYPFQFWLPFTTLNNRRIWLNATAEVRLENQIQ